MGGGAKNVLCTFFFFAALIAYCWYARKPGLAPVSGIHRLVCFGTDVEADGHHSPVCALAAGLLAAGQDSSRPGRVLPQAPLSKLIVEKLPLLALSAASAVITMQAQQRGWGRALHRAVLARRASGKCSCGVRHVFVEDDLAVPSGSHLSSSRRFAGRVAGGDISPGAAGGDWRGAEFPG